MYNDLLSATKHLLYAASGMDPSIKPYDALIALHNLKERVTAPPQGQAQPNSILKQDVDGIQAALRAPAPMGIAPRPMAPQMAPQVAAPVAPPAAPPQAAPAAPAEGGLPGLPVKEGMFNYNDGGIVAFDGGGGVEGDQSDAETSRLLAQEKMANEAEIAQNRAMPAVPRGLTPQDISGMKPEQIAQQILVNQMMGKTSVPEYNYAAEKEAFMRANPDMATPIGEGLVSEIARQREAAKTADKRFITNEASRGIADLSNALIAAGQGTRGKKGVLGDIGGAFAGLGQSINPATNLALDRREAHERMNSEQAFNLAKLESDIADKRRAAAQNDFAAESQAKQSALQRIQHIEQLQAAGATAVTKNQLDKLKLDADISHQKATEGYQNRMAKNAENRLALDQELKPTAEDKRLAKVQANVNNDDTIASLSRNLADSLKAGTIGFGSPEYYNVLDAIHELKIPYYKDANLKPPSKPSRGYQAPQAVQEKSWWSKNAPEFLGGEPKVAPGVKFLGFEPQ